MNLGKRILQMRKNKNWTQQELAEKIFVTDKAISSWESGRTEPNLEIIIKLSELFDCSVSYLIYGNVERSDVETEIKIKISHDVFNCINNFMLNNADFIKENRQIDTYYQPFHKPFLKGNGEIVNEWLRIGIRGNKKILNYKNWYDNKYCDEYEVEIDNDTNLDRIFKALGLEKIVIVDKTRKSYFYLDKYEVSLDYVKELGYFIEIEVKNYSESALAEYDKLLKVAKSLNLNLDDIDKRGYPYHLIYDV